MKMTGIKGIGLATVLGSGLSGCGWADWTPNKDLKSAATDRGLDADSLERSVNEYCERDGGTIYYINQCKYRAWKDATNSDSVLIARARKRIQKQKQELVNAVPSAYEQGVADGKKAILDSISKINKPETDSALKTLVSKIVEAALDSVKIKKVR